jgi:hypothetical protein
MRRGRCADQQVGCIVTLADPTVFDRETRAAQDVNDRGYRTEVESMARERHLGHCVRVGQSYDDPTRASNDPDEFGDRIIPDP